MYASGGLRECNRTRAWLSVQHAERLNDTLSIQQAGIVVQKQNERVDGLANDLISAGDVGATMLPAITRSATP